MDERLFSSTDLHWIKKNGKGFAVDRGVCVFFFATLEVVNADLGLQCGEDWSEIPGNRALCFLW